MDINVDLQSGVIYRPGFSPYQVLREWNHSIMLQPENIQINTADFLPEWSFSLDLF